MDVLFVSPNASKLYQDLADLYSAIEPPTWSLLLAEACRAKGYGVAILDCEALRLTPQESVNSIVDANPRLVCFVTYGQNPNSGTTNMSATLQVARLLREQYPQFKTVSIGTHTSALPQEMLKYEYFDFVSINEGVYTLLELLQTDFVHELDKVSGLGYKKGPARGALPHTPLAEEKYMWGNSSGPQAGEIQLNPGKVVPTELMDVDLPGYAWDLLPYKERPLDLYRSHFWHTNYQHEKRTPFVSLYTSLGCVKRCNFCIINLINRTSPALQTSSADSHHMRFWSTDWIIKQIDLLQNKYGVETLRIADELFYAYKKHYEPILNQIIERKFQLNWWSYTRIDTVREEFLDLFKKAGCNYLGVGIECSSQVIRKEIDKGSFKEVNIRDVRREIGEAGINAGLNYMFGFPNEKLEDLQATLDLALELKGEFSNFYGTVALPGSPLYYEFINNGWELPKEFSEYGFFSYDHVPCRTNYLTAAEVLKFRDEAWTKYFTDASYLNMIESKFGALPRKNIEDQAKIKLKRKILGD